MAVSFRNLDETRAWQALKGLPRPRMRELLDAARVGACETSYRLGLADSRGETLAYNYAAKLVDDEVLAALADLADEQELIDKYRMILAGETMNTAENRAVLHHLTRGELAGPVIRDGRNLGEFYAEQRRRFGAFARAVHSGAVTSAGGRRFESVVQIGIGGSDLGPRALFLALEGHQCEAPPGPEAGRGGSSSSARRRGPLLETRFISNIDPDDAAAVLAGLDPHTTLFVLVSKSGTTQETLTNELMAVDWLERGGVSRPKRQIVAVTSQTSPLATGGDYLDSFYIDDYIGGRYSSTSAVGGVILSLAYGPTVFDELLAGAHAADAAALEPDPRHNPALLDALLGVYERNVLGFPSTAVLPYSQALLRFPAHLQQLDMESNGKRVNRDGGPIGYATGPVIFGEPGTNGQHSFYQLLHQGTDVVPLQFIGFANAQRGHDLEVQGSTSQQKLVANLMAQIVAFAIGKDDDNPNKAFPGGRPASLLWSDRLTPRVLGALLAHFENKVMFQGLTWNVNSFDQEGVQLGKVLTGEVLSGRPLAAALGAFVERFRA